MIKLLEEIKNVGEEVKCKNCGSVVHCEEHDWKNVRYFYYREERVNKSIDCPKCYCAIYRWEDR
jgi:hypothetical protein